MKTVRISIVLLFFGYLWAGCAANHTVSDLSKTQWVPSNIDLKNTILLIEKYPYSRNQHAKMLEYVAKKYKGRYVVADKEAITSKNGMYADSKLYKYALLWSLHTWERTQSGTLRTSTRVYTDCRFLDRETGKEYPTPGHLRGYSAAAYIPVFNTLAPMVK